MGPKYFTEQERAALQLAEPVTLMSEHCRLPDRGIDPYATLDDAEITAVT